MAEYFSEMAPEVQEFAKICRRNAVIDTDLYSKYDVKRGLRDVSGKGVLTGLTEVSEIRSYTIVDQDMIPCEGKLYFQGIDIEELTAGFLREDRFGFEETAYLLIFGELPNKEQASTFKKLLANYRSVLPTCFVRDIILKAPSADMMNTLARSVLTLYSYDDCADDTSVENVLRQCLQLIALFPMLAVYGYQAYSHYQRGNSLFIHQPVEEFSTAENIYIYCVRIVNLQNLRQRFWILH